MSMKFSILWFEDNEEWYEANKENLEEYLTSRNFIAEFKRYDSTDEIAEITSFFEYDLILVDLKLDHNTKGTNAIQAIRDKNILSDALFYSSDGVDKIRSEMGMEVFEGVYFSARDDILFEDKAEKLINKAIRRMEDIVSTRGILVDSLCEFDEKLRLVIMKFYSSYADTPKAEEIDRYAYKLVTKQLRSTKNKCDALIDSNFLGKVLTSTYLIDSAKLAQIVQHIFNKHYPEHSYRTDFYDTYVEKIITERNHLAHAKKETKEDGLFYFENNDQKIIYDSKKCSEIRSSINLFTREIEKMLNLII